MGELTAQEHAELAKFASALIRAKHDKAATKASALVKQAAERVYDPEDFEHVAGLCVYLSKYAANAGFNWSKASDYVLKGGLLASALAPIITPIIQAHKRASKHESTFKEIVKEHPSLGGNNIAVTKRHFDVLKTFAPDIASNSLVAGNVLHRMHRLGPGMMDINQVKELASTQAQLQSGTGKDTLKTVGDLMKTVGETIKPVDPQAREMAAVEQDNKFMRAMQERDKLTSREVNVTSKLKREADLLRAQKELARLHTKS